MPEGSAGTARGPIGGGFYTRTVPSDRPFRLGLLGGTFDPPHVGHLAAALAVASELDLDRVDFLPANDPWQKTAGGRVVSPAGVRLEMARALVEGHPSLGIDDREIRRGGPTYTVDTLREIRREHPGTDVHLIIGSDTARQFQTWKDHEEVARLSTLVVVNRPDTPAERPSGADRVVFVSMDEVAVSSSAVRAAVSAGTDVSAMVTPAVARIISAHGLYGARR